MVQIYTVTVETTCCPASCLCLCLTATLFFLPMSLPHTQQLTQPASAVLPAVLPAALPAVTADNRWNPRTVTAITGAATNCPNLRVGATSTCACARNRQSPGGPRRVSQQTRSSRLHGPTRAAELFWPAVHHATRVEQRSPNSATQRSLTLRHHVDKTYYFV